MHQDTTVDFRPLYRIAQRLSFLMLVIIPLQIVIYVAAPPPATVQGLFGLFRQNAFLGLLSLDFLYLFNNLIIVIVYLALAALLYRERPVTVLLALMLGLIGVACYYSTNPAFEMLTLSRTYSLAQAGQQSIYLAAGEALMAGYTGTAFNTYYVLSTICLLLFAHAIITSGRLRKPAGYWGLASGIFMIVPSSAGTLGMAFSLLSLVPWVVFVALLMAEFGRRASPQADAAGSGACQAV